MASSMPPGDPATAAAAAGLPFVRFEINAERLDPRGRPGGRGLHSFLSQLNLSSSVHRITQIDS